jgi:hypothetical protein
MAVLAGWLVATGAWAQQAHGGNDVPEEQGGFVVIEDSTTPPPPPKPLPLPATTIPLGGAQGNASPYKPGSAVYAIPWAKHGSATTEPKAAVVAPRSATATTATAASAAKTSGTLPSTAAPTAAFKPVAPPPPSWSWTIKQGYSIEQQLKDMAKKARWNVVWNYHTDILAGADWTSHDDFPTTAEKIISILSSNGALIHYRTFTGNNTFVVYGPGVSTP